MNTCPRPLSLPHFLSPSPSLLCAHTHRYKHCHTHMYTHAVHISLSPLFLRTHKHSSYSQTPSLSPRSLSLSLSSAQHTLTNTHTHTHAHHTNTHTHAQSSSLFLPTLKRIRCSLTSVLRPPPSALLRRPLRGRPDLQPALPHARRQPELPRAAAACAQPACARGPGSGPHCLAALALACLQRNQKVRPKRGLLIRKAAMPGSSATSECVPECHAGASVSLSRFPF